MKRLGKISISIFILTVAILAAFVLVLRAQDTTMPVQTGTISLTSANLQPQAFTTNDLWLEVSGVSNATACLVIHIPWNETNGVYDLFGTTNPGANVPGLSVTNWVWLARTAAWQTNINMANLWPDTGFFILGTMLDSDGDGLTDAYEKLVSHTNPNLYSTDGTGMSDGWEIKYFGYIGVDPNGDYDNDGVGNLQEYQNGTDPNKIQFALQFTNTYFNTSIAHGTVAILGGVPSYMAILINDTNFADANWQPYISNVVVNLNAGDGNYSILVGLRGLPSDAQQTWQWAQLTLDTVALTLTVTNPASSVVPVPMIQLQGYASKPLSSLLFDVSNATGIFTNQQGYLTGQFYDTNLLTYTTNFFQCPDIALGNGLNTVTLHAIDWAGSTTNITFTLNYSGNTNPLNLTVIWPQDGTYISGSSFTLEGQVDDTTAKITATIMDANGNTNTVQGLVECNGIVWAQNLPLAAGANALAITATVAAGNASTTRLTLFQGSVTVTMNPLMSYQLNQPAVTVYGTVSDATTQVYVNGVQASVNEDGTWEADNVPISAIGTAIFDVEVYSGEGMHVARTVLPEKSGGTSSGVQSHDLPSGTATSSQIFTQTQPVTVGMMSYSGRHQLTYWNNVEEAINWFYQTGGNCNGGEDPFEISPNENGVAYASFNWLTIPFIMPWEYASLTVFQPAGNINYPFGNYTQTRVMIEPSGQVSAGMTNLYLVLANASEFSFGQINDGLWTTEYGVPYDLMIANIGSIITYSGYAGALPLPPEWLQIRGQTLINSGITNGDGSVWGDAIVQAPAGVNWDVTPVATQVHQYWDYTFDVRANEVNLQLGVDANRDGNITFDAADNTTPAKPFRFWINDDHDGYDSSIDDYDDLNPSTGTDSANSTISCTRDLEDFTRLWINTQGITEELQNGTFLLTLEWKDVVNDPQIRIFQAFETDGGTLYLTDTNTAESQQMVAPYNFNIIDRNDQWVVTKNQPFIFDAVFWGNVSSNQPVAHLLFEGVNRGSGKLVLSIYKNDGVTKLAESQPLYLKLEDVKEMYERWTVGESGTPSTTATLVTSPYQYDSSIMAENNYILFIHGWNLALWERDAFAETAFKRLYWQGYKGHFGAFQWPTEFGFSGDISGITDADNFDNSEFNAWSSAPALRGLLNILNGQYPGHVCIFAHSMGNIVAGEALKLSGSDQVVNTYVAMQAAIASHAYDPTTYVRTNDLNYLGVGYNSHAPNYYANYWTNGAPCYFNDTAGAANYINFYNQRDYALARWEVDEDFKPDGHAGFSYNSSANKFYFTGNELYFPHDTYVLFPYCTTAFCYGLGEQANVGGAFLSLGEPNQLNLDTTFDFGNTHAGHSAEFNSDNMNRATFWNTLLDQMGLLQ